MTAADRWEPDDQLVPSLLAGPRPELKLSQADRSWAVAGLTLAGKTAEDIAERLGVSLRLVRTIRSDPMTQVCLFYQHEVATFESELRMANSDHHDLGQQLSSTEAELARVKAQLNRIIGPTTFRCGHPRTKYNTQTWTDRSTGRKKSKCLTCHRDRMTAKRHPETVPTVGGTA